MVENKKRNLLVATIAFLVLLLVFTFTDLKIALWIYQPDSLFGRFFEIVGTLPMPIVGIFSCMALIITAERRLKISTIVSYVAGVLLMMYFAFYGYYSFIHALPQAQIPMAIATIAWIPASAVLVLKIVKSGNGEGLRKAAIIAVFSCAVAVIGVSQIKNFMSRPRFSRLENPTIEFTYWFQRQPHTDLSVDSSFPSGHSAQSALSLCVLLLPMFIKKLDNAKFYKVATCVAGVFTVCVMISRMVLGMHYATDVLVGAMLPIVTMMLADYGLVIKMIKENEKFYIQQAIV